MIAPLQFTAKRHFLNASIAVNELVWQGEIASPTTLHATLNILIKKKLLTTQHSERDGRVKQVTLSKLALEFFIAFDRTRIRLR